MITQFAYVGDINLGATAKIAWANGGQLSNPSGTKLQSLSPFLPLYTGFAVGYDDTNIGAGAANLAMSGLGASSEGDFLPFPFAIVGISVRANADVTQGTVTVEAVRDGVATGLTAVLNTVNPRQKGTTQAVGTMTTGRISARYSTSGDLLPAGTTEIEVYVFAVADLSGVV